MRLSISLLGILVGVVAILGGNGPVMAQGGGEGIQPIQSKVFQGKVYCSSIYPVVSTFTGEVVEKRAKMGQFVHKDDVLLKVALQEKDRYALDKRVDKELELLSADMNIATFKRELSQSQKQKHDTDKLIAEGMASEQAGKDIASEIEFQKLKIKHAEQQLATLKGDLAKERALLSTMLGQKFNKEVPGFALVTAPTSGYIVWEKYNLRVGALASAEVFEIGVMDPMIIRTQLFEADAAQIKPGDRAEVIVEFDPEVIRKAVVKSIAWLPVDRNIDTPSYYMVDLEIPNPDNTLKEGYKVRITFPTAGRPATQ